MPIDIRWLRSPDDAKQVSIWQSLRRRPTNSSSSNEGSGEGCFSSTAVAPIDDVDVDISHISDVDIIVDKSKSACKCNEVQHVIQVDRDFRLAQRKLDTYKSFCRQERKRLDREKLQAYQQECDELATIVKDSLNKIANTIDEILLSNFSGMVSQATKASKDVPEVVVTSKTTGIFQSFYYRRLIEVGALDVIGDLTDLSSGKKSNTRHQSSLLCWTGLGQDWACAISNCLNSHFTNGTHPTEQQQLLQLPPQLPLEHDILHALLGCSKSVQGQCCICSSVSMDVSASVAQAPSWLGFLRMKFADQTVGDKQLPKFIYYSCRERTQVRALAAGEDTATTMPSVIDPREEHRRESFPDGSTFKFEASSTQLDVHHILVLTPSTYFDSRCVQKNLADRLLSFYQSLLPAHVVTDSAMVGRVVVRQRVVSPLDLLSAEASRILIEGYLLKQKKSERNNGSENGSWIVLGYLSNFSDYPTRACRIKNNQQQFCHVLQGVLCSLPETMRWLTCHGIRPAKNSENNEGCWNIFLSDFLAQNFPRHYPNPLVLPQVRALDKTKRGRVQIRTLRTLQTNKMSPICNCTDSNDVSLQPPVAKNNEENKPRRAARIVQVAPLVKLTATQIQGEALSSPHDFLF